MRKTRRKPTVVKDIRLKSAAGYYLGSLEFSEDEVAPYDRESLYYPSEEMLKAEYPNSMSQEEAFEKYCRY